HIRRRDPDLGGMLLPVEVQDRTGARRSIPGEMAKTLVGRGDVGYRRISMERTEVYLSAAVTRPS
ncbi:MAG: hypothetical protein ACRDWB_05590, partial [Acidimicrobiales bacterium]